MRLMIVGLWVLVLAGCTAFSAKETCVPTGDGWQQCEGVATWERQPVCNGSCGKP